MSTRIEKTFVILRAPSLWYQDDSGAMLPTTSMALEKIEKETPIFFALAYERYNKPIR